MGSANRRLLSNKVPDLLQTKREVEQLHFLHLPRYFIHSSGQETACSATGDAMIHELIDLFVVAVLGCIAWFHIDLWRETKNIEIDTDIALPARRIAHVVVCVTLVIIGGYYFYRALTRM